MKLLGILVSAMLLPAFIYAGDTVFPFQLGQDQFDDEMTRWSTVLISNLAKKADELEADSDIAHLARRMKKTNLNDQLKDAAILSFAQALYTQIQQNETVMQAFETAQQSTTNEEPTDKRKEKWKEFRKVTAHQLVVLRKKELPSYKDPTPGSAEAFTELFERNKDLKLSQEQQKYYIAYSIVLYTSRQNHRLVDPSTDSPNILLHKKVTDPQN